LQEARSVPNSVGPKLRLADSSRGQKAIFCTFVERLGHGRESGQFRVFHAQTSEQAGSAKAIFMAETQYPVNSIFRKLTKVIWPVSIGFAPEHGGFETETGARWPK
jgi:hypothetical protein